MKKQKQIIEKLQFWHTIKLMYRLYKLVKFVDRENDKLADQDPPRTKTGAWGTTYIVTCISDVECIDNFAKLGSVTRKATEKIYIDAVGRGYLKVNLDSGGWETVEVAPGKGRIFLSKLWFFPIGFLNEYLDNYGKATSFIAGLFTMAISLGILAGLWNLLVYGMHLIQHILI